MKRCPQCNRVETDDALVFCRTDGTSLVSDSLQFPGEAGTARLGSTATESETSLLPHAVTDPGSVRTTGSNKIPTPQADPGPRPVASTRNSLIAGAIGILLVTALGVVS